MNNSIPDHTFYSFSEIMNDNSLPPSPIIDNGILLKKTLLLINGPQKIGKSFLIGNLGLAIATGQSFACFKISKPHKVLIFSTEGGHYPNRDRIKKMAQKTPDVKDGYFRVTWRARFKVDEEQDYSGLKQVISIYQPDVVIFDPFVHFHNSEENSASEMSKVLFRFRQLIEEFDISIILIHHSGKDISKNARGSSAILGEYDSNIKLSREKGSSELKLEFDMRHVETPEHCSIYFNKDTFWFEGAFKEHPIVTILKTTGPKLKKDVVKIALDEGIYKNNKTVYRHLTSLEQSKSIFKNKKGEFTLGQLSLENFSEN